jgi:hypothetical protein
MQQYVIVPGSDSTELLLVWKWQADDCSTYKVSSVHQVYSHYCTVEVQYWYSLTFTKTFAVLKLSCATFAQRLYEVFCSRLHCLHRLSPCIQWRGA